MNTYALITGASKGIGRSIAMLLAKKGYPVLLVARAEDELKALAQEITALYKVQANWLAVDLSTNDAAQKVRQWSTENSYPVSILVNNAGYGIWGNFESVDINGQLNMICLNINALIKLTHLFISELKQQPQAYILNVCSTAAYQAVPTLAVYSATKAFVLSFSRALRYELKDSTVSVSCLSPGPTDTGFAHRAGLDALADLAAKFNMQPAEVAALGLKGMFNKKAEIIPGFLNKLSVGAARHLPKALIEKIGGDLYKSK
ncbi:SDR family oxidoreductase [Mucilaginibacter sabulilitoris]|uniref:SDR family oxidoreductase n=1 Tax=Mucilaginibacter sabulilitoris TaxID=1173583 RepID=A0ABZ0TMQ1_9SPHI|nr:SDR family oxidoreductase [Mucilaginibacter sabulilitoris]WPU93393.1 SDR family oxidoreductase [Mucilaginibacter sabulilitoris]